MAVGLLLIGLLAANETPDPCPAGLGGAMAQLCLGDEEAARGAASPAGNAEQRLRFETAAQHYRLASRLGTVEDQLRALTALALMYDVQRLNDPSRRDGVLHELRLLVPSQSSM